MIAQNVADYVRRTFGDEASIQITDEDILRWTNAAQREISSRNHVLKQTATADITEGINEYSIAGLPVAKIVSLRVNNRPIENRSFQQAEEYILKNDPDHTVRGIPQLWYKWGTSIFFWPMPSTTFIEGLKIHFIANPVELTTLGDTLSLPDEYFNRIIEYVLAQAYELDEDGQAHNMKLQQFNEAINTEGENNDRPQYETYGVITVLPGDDWYGY